jgi:hypothetical protein
MDSLRWRLRSHPCSATGCCFTIGRACLLLASMNGFLLSCGCLHNALPINAVVQSTGEQITAWQVQHPFVDGERYGGAICKDTSGILADIRLAISARFTGTTCCWPKSRHCTRPIDSLEGYAATGSFTWPACCTRFAVTVNLTSTSKPQTDHSYVDREQWCDERWYLYMSISEANVEFEVGTQAKDDLAEAVHHAPCTIHQCTFFASTSDHFSPLQLHHISSSSIVASLLPHLFYLS